ncbi:hypothetical protein EXIGLDRAFT_771922 [Exidia glandulosa HHB12029]|uniref:Uncharacterized protein n=1 Tax=Exidia glandulosa HHB12029 TaxID=1314781 RepID=A0A165FNM4_EXIGL|nr:hypothetical protein EXIGLDRAFT_771922 [Exidia glandulosa HHB12029]
MSQEKAQCTAKTMAAPKSKLEPSAIAGGIVAAFLVGLVAVLFFRSRRQRRLRPSTSPYPLHPMPSSAPPNGATTLKRATNTRDTHSPDDPPRSPDHGVEDENAQLRAAVARMQEEMREWRLVDLESLPSYETRSHHVQ